jgi:hypothetical protein
MYATRSYFPQRGSLHLSPMVIGFQSQSHIATDGQSVSKSWCRAHLGLMAGYLLVFDSYGLVFVGRPLLREDGSVFCTCCWLLPLQSLPGPSPLGLETVFYRLRFETSLFVAPYDSQGHGAVHHEDEWGEWMYRSTFSWPRHKLEVCGQTPRPLYSQRKSPGTHW